MNPVLRKSLLIAAVAFALLAPAVQAMTGWGLDQRQFADQGDETLRAAGYAFSIWGLIYAGLAAHTVAQLWDKGRLEPLFAALSPSIVAIAGCGAWIVASAADARWASVVIILVSAASAWWALKRAGPAPAGWAERLLAVWPIALLGGWLLAAAALNILTVLTAEGLIGVEGRAGWALSAIAGVVALAALALRSGVSLVYVIPAAWGLLGVFAAERGDQPVAAYAAAGGAVVALGAAGYIHLRRRAAA